jgi:hypothetical protein
MSINNLMSMNSATSLTESRFGSPIGHGSAFAQSSKAGNGGFDPMSFVRDSVDIDPWGQEGEDEGESGSQASQASSGSGSDDWETVLARTLAKHGAPQSVFDDQVKGYRNLMNDINKPDEPIRCTAGQVFDNAGAGQINHNQGDDDNIHCVFMDPVSTNGIGNQNKNDDDNIHCVFMDPVSTSGIGNQNMNDDDNIHCTFMDPISTSGIGSHGNDDNIHCKFMDPIPVG